jgi:hypothetical protein
MNSGLTTSLPGILVLILGAVAAGFLAGSGAVYLFNHLPAAWLGETQRQPGEQRLSGWPWKYALAAAFSVIGIDLAVQDWRYAAAALSACWVLLLLGLAAGKYRRVPDPLVLLLALTGLGFAPYLDWLRQMLPGAAVGAGGMLAVELILAHHRGTGTEGLPLTRMGAAIGLIGGWTGMVWTYLLGGTACGIAAALRLRRRRRSGEGEKTVPKQAAPDRSAAPGKEEGAAGSRSFAAAAVPYFCAAAAFYLVVVQQFLQ